MKNLINKIKCWWYGCEYELHEVIYHIDESIVRDGLTFMGKNQWYCKRCNRKL